MERAIKYTRDSNTTQIVGVVEVGHQNLQGPVCIAAGGRNGADDRFKERLQVGSRSGDFRAGKAKLAVRVEHWEIKLVFGGIEIYEQVINLVEHLLRTRVGTVY